MYFVVLISWIILVVHTFQDIIALTTSVASPKRYWCSSSSCHRSLAAGPTSSFAPAQCARANYTRQLHAPKMQRATFEDYIREVVATKHDAP
jgi:hypothetical protein